LCIVADQQNQEQLMLAGWKQPSLFKAWNKKFELDSIVSNFEEKLFTDEVGVEFNLVEKKSPIMNRNKWLGKFALFLLMDAFSKNQ
jgi:hypothetical protein